MKTNLRLRKVCYEILYPGFFHENAMFDENGIPLGVVNSKPLAWNELLLVFIKMGHSITQNYKDKTLIITWHEENDPIEESEVDLTKEVEEQSEEVLLQLIEIIE